MTQPPDVQIRPLEPDELVEAWRLGRLAFGGPATQPPDLTADHRPATRWGAFAAGRLLAKATDLHHEQYWGAQVVPACGVAGVAVLPEHRRQGLTRRVLTALLHGADERGAAVSNLFCTSAAVYRALGWEVTGFLREVELPTAALNRPSADAVRARSGSGRDLPATHAVYDQVARTTNAMLTRREHHALEADREQLPDGIDGLTIAEDPEGRVVGYATWVRGDGYGPPAVLSVRELLATSVPAAAALLGVLGSWHTVTPTLRLRLLPGADPVNALLPLEQCRAVRTDVWLHRPVNVSHAVAARGWLAGVSGAVTVRLVDPLLPPNDGAFRLTVDDGCGTLESVPDDHDRAPTLHIRGWSQLWCGTASASQLRLCGLLAGGEPADDEVLDRLFAAPGVAALLDYF